MIPRLVGSSQREGIYFVGKGNVVGKFKTFGGKKGCLHVCFICIPSLTGIIGKVVGKGNVVGKFITFGGKKGV